VTHLDSTFLVDLLRERRRNRRGPASAKLETLRLIELAMSIFAVCELWTGVERAADKTAERERVDTLCQTIETVYPDEKLAPEYARLLTALERRGQRIGTMDLLIAASAVAAGAPLVTRNAREFSRIPELRVISY